MTTKVCANCQQFFSGDDNLCENCKFIKDKKIEQMANLVGAMEMLAILREVKEESGPNKF